MSQPVAATREQLLDRVVWVRRQVLVQALVEGATRGALLGAPVWVAALIAVRSPQVAAFELLFFASAGALYRFLKAPDQRGAARHADAGLDLEDRLLTALDRLGDESPMAELQRRDALEAFGAAAHQTLRSAWPRWSLLSLTLVALVAGAARFTAADEVSRVLVVVSPAQLAADSGQLLQEKGPTEGRRGELASAPTPGKQAVGEQASGGAGQQRLPPGAKGGEPDEGPVGSTAASLPGEGADREGGAAAGAGGTGRDPGTTAPGTAAVQASPLGLSDRAIAAASQGAILRLQRRASGPPVAFAPEELASAGGVSGPTALGLAQSPLFALPARYHAVIARYVAGSVAENAQTETKP